jgi:hypothetical protein
MEPEAHARRRGLAAAVLVAAVCALGASASHAATEAHFRSPSGSINCYVFPGEGGAADCVVRSASWKHLPAKPEACDLDWSPTEVQLGRTAVSVGQCRGDVGPRCYSGGGRCSVLAYGRSITIGTIRCSSAPSGVTCRRTTGARPGFRVAREGVVVFR